MTERGPARLKAGMVGFGMIFDETYRPFFERVSKTGLWSRETGEVDVQLSAVATRTGKRAEAYLKDAGGPGLHFQNFAGDSALEDLLKSDVDFVCIASPDDRHFDAARRALLAGKHVLIEKPSVLRLDELDELISLANERGRLAKVVYHKLLDPDHKRLRTLVADGVLQHVNNGYCSLLEPRSISGSQFSEWIAGRNPATYVAVHYFKLIDFTFGGRLKTVLASGQRGIVGAKDGPTWDSVQTRLIYEYDDGREAAFDIHTSWVTPDNFPGYVEQEVQFRFDNGVWNGHSRKRGVEVTVADRTPHDLKTTINTHYNGKCLEPWGERAQRGYGIEVIERFVREVAFVEYGGSEGDRNRRLSEMQGLQYNDVAADRQVVAAVQAVEAILEEAAAGRPDAVVRLDESRESLVLQHPGSEAVRVLWSKTAVVEKR